MSEQETLPTVIETEVLPSASPRAVVEAFGRYREIQTALDKALPESVMTIRGKQFRKKSYWRAIATAFNLTLSMQSEGLVEHLDGNDGDDWGYQAVYRAATQSGRYADGDGMCMASEKGSGQATVHNVRAHAHTRAMNRAISNLVGFGEVSAEEVNEEPRQAPRRRESRPARSEPEAPEVRLTFAQRLWMAARDRAKDIAEDSITDETIVRDVLARFKVEHTNDVGPENRDAAVMAVKAWEVPE